MKEWLEYEIELTPSDNADQLISEEKEVVKKLHLEMEKKAFFWTGYFGAGYHRLRWGIKTDKCIFNKLKALLPDHDISIWDPLQESWAEDDELYNHISGIKADACVTAAWLFNFESKYDWHGMSMYIHFLMNSLGFNYLEEALACSRNAYECLSNIPHKQGGRES